MLIVVGTHRFGVVLAINGVLVGLVFMYALRMVVVMCEWACHCGHSWVVRRSFPSMGWHCGHSSLFMLVVSCGVHVVDGGGHLWVVVKFIIMGGDVVGTHCCLCWCCCGVSRGAHIVAGGHLWAVEVAVVTGW